MGTDDQLLVSVECTLTFKDHLRLGYWHSFCRSKVRGLLLIGIPWLVFLLVALSRGRAARATAWAVYAMACVLWILYLGALTWWKARRGYATHGALRLPWRFTFSMQGIESQSQVGAGQTDWRVCYRVFETKTDFYLYHADGLAQIVPKRCFRSPEDMDAFRNILRASLAPGVLRLRT
jgi:hypothetical protein